MTTIDPSKLIITVNGKPFTVNIPQNSDIQIRKEQNPNCNRSNHICGLFKGQLICLEVNPKPDKDGSVDLGEIRICRHNQEKRIRI